MSHPLNPAPSPVLSPLGAVGRIVLDVVHYLGGMGLLGIAAIGSIVRPVDSDPPLRASVMRQLDRIIRYAMPLVALMHIGLGSFLAMQAYFGATFLDGVGPVVGVGLVRNIAPLMSGMTLAGLFAAVFTTELRGADRGVLDREATWLPDRGVTPGRRDAVEPTVSLGRLAASRMIAAVLAGPLMVIWASLVGITVGFGVASSILNVTAAGFFDMFIEMLWVRDVVGIFLKGMTFGLVTSWFACYEGLRRDASTTADPGASLRAATLSGIALLAINSAWFLLFYHAGPAFGPTVLRPPLS